MTIINNILTNLTNNIFITAGIFFCSIVIGAIILYLGTRLVSYAIYRSRLQIYSNFKTKEKAHEKKKRQEKIVKESE